MPKSYEIDMCHGPLAGKILRFSLPLMLSSMLQLIFNAADVIVVGRFSGSEALAAVGSTGPLINLMINLFIGLSVGANVVVARALGANHINISMIAQGSDEMNITVGVKEEDFQKTIQVIYDTFVTKEGE